MSEGRSRIKNMRVKGRRGGEAVGRGRDRRVRGVPPWRGLGVTVCRWGHSCATPRPGLLWRFGPCICITSTVPGERSRAEPSVSDSDCPDAGVDGSTTNPPLSGLTSPENDRSLPRNKDDVRKDETRSGRSSNFLQNQIYPERGSESFVVN